MKPEIRNEIYQLIKGVVSRKVYGAEAESKPFVEALFDKEDILLASVIHSMYTSFGMSIYEPVLQILAGANGFNCERRYLLRGHINERTRLLIENISVAPIGSNTKSEEINMIRESNEFGPAVPHPDSTVDVFIRTPGEELYIDITSAKPNKKEARALRKKLLTWAALRLSQNPKAVLKTLVGIPYNPYHPEPYSRGFVIANLQPDEVLVQEGFWDFVGGPGTFQALMEIFNQVGNEAKAEIRKVVRGE